MERGEVIAWMKRRGLNNRQLAQLLGISEDKVSKSLTDKGKPRLWKAAEALRIAELMRADEPRVQSEVRGTGMTPEQARDAWAMRDAKPVPLLGTAFGSEWSDDGDIETTELHLGEVIDRLDRPPSLAGDEEAYAVEIVGDSMAPRFEPGEFAFVSPKAPVRIGDDVIVQLRGTGEDQLADRVAMVLIKRLVRRSSAYVDLRQFNPDKTFKVPADRVHQIHRVRGRL